MKTYLAEVLGTFLLVFIGTSSVVTGGFGGALPLGQEGIGLAFGIGLIAAAYAIGPISGAHLNPAVTLGVFLAGRLPAKDVIPYWIAQILWELIGTFTFVTVILGVTAEKHSTAFAGLVIGLTLAGIHFAMIPVTGTSVNPARSIGPALFTGGAALSQLWLFIVAPLIGGAIAGVVAKARIFEKD